ncbi:hypothetical protein BDW02DRAFT_594958 [Decorospora gaudefroyi]|uniref:Uncharacterized protein n=1 Tax=Decorospora gaudefroyi TaxID=184978 RepID=A0A6A5KQ31_9PLEO|nr:hypothetical protein BDW02DRAFT_594958 [Decorospora gaudefroyi]
MYLAILLTLTMLSSPPVLAHDKPVHYDDPKWDHHWSNHIPKTWPLFPTKGCDSIHGHRVMMTRAGAVTDVRPGFGSTRAMEMTAAAMVTPTTLATLVRALEMEDKDEAEAGRPAVVGGEV